MVCSFSAREKCNTTNRERTKKLKNFCDRLFRLPSMPIYNGFLGKNFRLGRRWRKDMAVDGYIGYVDGFGFRFGYAS